MNTFHLDYDDEGDILAVRWGPVRVEASRGIELSDNIVLFADRDFRAASGLTLLSYRRLLESPSVALTNLSQMPAVVQTRIRALLRQEPLSRFLRLTDNTVAMRGGQILITSNGPLLAKPPRRKVNSRAVQVLTDTNS